MFLQDEELRETIRKALTPVRDEHFGAVSYDLTVGKLIAPGERPEETDTFVLRPWQTVFAASEEVLTVPDDCIGFVTLRNSCIRMGLDLAVPVYYPGHKTRIFARLTNLSGQDIVLRKGDSVVSLMLSRLAHATDHPYRGKYEKQLDFAKVGSARSTKLPEVRKETEKGPEEGRNEDGRKLVYPACFYPFENGSGYTVVVPDLPGCVSEGADLADAIAMGTDAALGWVQGEIEDGKEPPRPSRIGDIHPDSPDGFVSLLVFDTGSVMDKEPSAAVSVKDRAETDEPALMGPYSVSEVPAVRIDYRGLAAYAKRQGKHVCDLSDEEKNLFIKDGDMDLIRKIAIKK